MMPNLMNSSGYSIWKVSVSNAFLLLNEDIYKTQGCIQINIVSNLYFVDIYIGLNLWTINVMNKPKRNSVELNK